MHTLPEGYTVRPARREDAAQMAAVVQLVQTRSLGEAEDTASTVLGDMEAPGMNLATDSLVVWTPDGATCAGMVLVMAPPPYLRNTIAGVTHPEHERKGIGTYLFSWGLARARELVPLAEADKRVIAVGNCYANMEDAIQLMSDQGLSIARRFFEMRIDLREAPALPAIPQGFTIRAMDLQNDTVPLFGAIEETFRDHYGHVERPFEVGLQRWKHYQLENETFDPAMVLIAEVHHPETGAVEIAGFSVHYPDLADPAHAGYLHQIGVRRPWRRRGLAEYLLRKTFEIHWRRGASMVHLGVDATNPTGAMNLYKKAGMYEFMGGVAMEIVLREGTPQPNE